MCHPGLRSAQLDVVHSRKLAEFRRRFRRDNQSSLGDRGRCDDHVVRPDYLILGCVSSHADLRDATAADAVGVVHSLGPSTLATIGPIGEAGR